MKTFDREILVGDTFILAIALLGVALFPSPYIQGLLLKAIIVLSLVAWTIPIVALIVRTLKSGKLRLRSCTLDRGYNAVTFWIGFVFFFGCASLFTAAIFTVLVRKLLEVA